MKIQLLLSASLFMLVSGKSLAQENNCDVRQLQVSTYDFVLKNLDSIKKYTPNKDLITAAIELTETGKANRIAYYTAFGENGQKEIKVWKGLETYVKESFSRCPDSHFYEGRDQVLRALFRIPLIKETIAMVKKGVESGDGYIAPDAKRSDIAPGAKFKVELRSLTVGKKTADPIVKEGVMDYYRSKMVRITDKIFNIGFEIVKVSGVNYLQYTLYERIDNKSQTVTKELWRPIVDNKVNLSVKGIRDDHPGVKHLKAGEEFDFDIEITFSK